MTDVDSIEVKARGEVCLYDGKIELERDESAIGDGPTGGGSVPPVPSTRNLPPPGRVAIMRAGMAFIWGMSARYGHCRW